MRAAALRASNRCIIPARSLRSFLDFNVNVGLNLFYFSRFHLPGHMHNVFIQNDHARSKQRAFPWMCEDRKSVV